MSAAELKAPHLFVENNGQFNFGTSGDDVSVGLPVTAIAEIDRRLKFEQHAEQDPHFVYVTGDHPRAVALIANRNLSHYGHRFLPHRDADRTLDFFGETIGESDGILFLDPIAIGFSKPT